MTGRDLQSDLKVAYGMGVHFPDVRRVYHLGSPWTVLCLAVAMLLADVGIWSAEVESYLQQLQGCT